ncbi:MAG: hypothetical protein V3V35_05655 [Dehalococcoidia bacterium]
MATFSRQMALKLGELPQGLRPMLGFTVAEPFDAPGWLFHGTWGGLRILAFVAQGQARLVSGAGLDVTEAFADVAEAVAAAARMDGVVLDGELVARDRRGAPRLSLVARHLETAATNASKAPVTLHLSDILYHGYRSVLRWPLARRQALLQDAIAPSEAVQVAHQQERLGVSFFEAATGLGYEGVVAREASSRYYPATRSRRWLAVREQLAADLVVGGYTLGEGRGGPLGSLLLGAYDGDALLHVASVAGGFARDERAAVLERLASRHADECPFFDTPTVRRLLYWCEPRLVVRVHYSEVGPDGWPRFPVFRGFRPDVGPSDCTVDAIADRRPAHLR